MSCPRWRPDPTNGGGVPATAVIEEIHQGPFQESQEGEQTFELLGRVRYQIDGTDVRVTVTLGRCGGTALCPPLPAGRPGRRRLRPDNTTHDAVLAKGRHGRYPAPDGRSLILGALAGAFLLLAIVNLVSGPQPRLP
jgi:hypothetical protein